MFIEKFVRKKWVNIVSASAVFLVISACTWKGVAGWIIMSLLTAVFILKNDTVSAKLEKPIRKLYYAFSTFLCAALGTNFYQFRVTARFVYEFLEDIAWYKDVYLAGIAVLLGLFSIPAVAFSLSCAVTTVCRDYFSESKRIPSQQKYKWISAPKAWLILMVVYVLGMSAILRANFMYIDDVGRIVEGYQGGTGFSRYLFNDILTMLNLNVHTSDLSPFPQILAAGIMAITGLILLSVVYDRVYFTIVELSALVPLTLNPYFLECLSYKFDPPSMALSVFGGVFPLLFRKKKPYLYVMVSAIGTLVTCTTYQVSTCVFPMAVVFVAMNLFLQRENGRAVCQFCILSAAGFCIGMLYYYVFLMIPIAEYITYASGEPAPLKTIIPTILSNYRLYLQQFRVDFNMTWKLLLAVLGIAYGIAVLGLPGNKLISLAVAGVAASCMGLLCFGIYPAMEKPIFDARSMYGIGIFISLICIFVAKDRPTLSWKLPCLLTVYAFFSFSLLYGNCLAIQKDYTDFRIRETIQELHADSLLDPDREYWVEIYGDINFAPSLYESIYRYPILERLIPIEFGPGEWKWGIYGFFRNYRLDTFHKMESYRDEIEDVELKFVSESVYQRISASDEVILIELK